MPTPLVALSAPGRGAAGTQLGGVIRGLRDELTRQLA
jgi:hypothetical protein